MLLIVGEDVVELDPQLVIGIEAEKGERARRQHVHVLKRDVAIDGKPVAGEGGVVRRKDQRVGHIANADVAIEDIMHEAAAAAVGS